MIVDDRVHASFDEIGMPMVPTVSVTLTTLGEKN
jgi:hypothetical protein